MAVICTPQNVSDGWCGVGKYIASTFHIKGWTNSSISNNSTEKMVGSDAAIGLFGESVNL